MIGRAHAKLSVRQLEQLLPNRASEDPVSVRNYCLWKTMKLVNIVPIELSYLKSSERIGQRHKMCIFGEFVHHYHDHIKPVRDRKALNEVQADYSPSLIRNLYRL